MFELDFELHRPKALDHSSVLDNGKGTCFVCITVVLGQPACLSKEVCLNAGADWPNLLSVRGGGKLVQTCH